VAPQLFDIALEMVAQCNLIATTSDKINIVISYANDVAVLNQSKARRIENFN
jgi:hypothetical protein